MNRVWSTLDVKSVDEERRELIGVASTPATDRMGDIVEPKGAQFKLPLVLLWQHDKDKPIGQVLSAKVTNGGIEIRARIEKTSSSAVLRERFEEAWESIKLGLVRGLSIGFKPIEFSMMDDGGVRFMKWDWLELSAVTIPANQEASITAIKSIDKALLSGTALGPQSKANLSDSRVVLPGATGTQSAPAIPPAQTNTGKTMNIREQIEALVARKQATQARMSEMMETAASQGTTLDNEQSEQYDNDAKELKAIDAHLSRLKTLEEISVKTATPADGGQQQQQPQRSPGLPAGEGVIKTNSAIPKGTAFTRYTMALMLAKGNPTQAAEIAKQWDSSTPQVRNVLRHAANLGTTRLADMQVKAAVAAGTTTDASWANPLVQYNNMASEFVELLRPATVLGRIPGLRRVPFYARIPRQTAGVSGTFVGEGQPKPLDSLAFDNITMEPYKAAVIVVMTIELMRFSTPAAEELVRQDMINGIAQYLDERFLDPQYTGQATVSPASITNGANVTVATGSTVALTDTAVEGALGTFISSNLNLQQAVVIMSPTVALSLSMKRDAQDRLVFPQLTMNGGTWYGMPVITSNVVALAGSPTEAYIIIMDPTSVLLADDGGVDIDMSTEASVQMSDTPSAGATSLVSLWQNNLVGLRAERFINWKLRRANAVSIIRYNLSPSAT